jgi:hypothetical protein
MINGNPANQFQIAPATQSQHAVQLGQVSGTPSLNLSTLPATTATQSVQFGQVSGVVGQARNLLMSVPAASATATMTADEIIVETALGGLRYCLASFSKTINLGTTGAGGMDTGTAPANGFVALYAIYNPSTQTAALLAKNATGAVNPQIYNGGNMPAGYTASALVSVWPTNGSSQFVVAYQRGRKIGIPQVVLLNNSTTGNNIALSTSSAAPPNAVTVSGYASLSSTTQSNVGLALQDNNLGSVGAQTFGGAVGPGLAFGGPFNDLKVFTTGFIYYTSTNAAGTPTYTIVLTGYSI